VLVIEPAEVFQKHLDGLVAAVVGEHGVDIAKQFLEDDQLGGLAALLDLFAHLPEDVEAVVDVDQTDLPLALDLPVVALDLRPLRQRPLRQSGDDAIDINGGVVAVGGMAVAASGRAVGGAFGAKTSGVLLLVVCWTGCQSVRLVGLPLQLADLLLQARPHDQTHPLR
jgi:hypothetical protein